ncbi:MAG: FIST C-terminal domain-containing protein [Lachnospiraceae bacterium]|nr:FIST C-terminal domain-containing protein [Lachnospiraceae bacterium]
MIRSIVLYTEEIDDLELAAEELFAQAAEFEFEENSVAIMFMDLDTEYPELYELLHEKWDIPIVAATTVGILTAREGYCRSGISLMLMTASDCGFTVGMTHDLSVDNYPQVIRETYEALEKETGGEEVKLVLTLGAKPTEMAGDDIISVLDDMGKRVKVFGALASDMFSFTDFRVAFNDRVEWHAQIFILITGNVEPKFLKVQSLSGKANFCYEVTRSDRNLVYRLGNGTFLEALNKSGLGSDKVIVAGEYIQTPFVTVLEKPGGVRVEALRNLTRLDHETGSGLFLGGIPEGSSLELGLLNKEDVKTSVSEAFDEILEWLKNDGKNCSTILCCSCTARFLAIGNDGTLEAESYQGRLPEGVSLMGMYSYGEYCPFEEEEWYNVFHNSTFTILCL